MKFSPNTSFSFFCTYNIVKTYFDQRLDCTAPKPWSEYTTNMQFWDLVTIHDCFLNKINRGSPNSETMFDGALIDYFLETHLL